MPRPKIRSLSLDPGQLAWAHGCPPYELPSGLVHNCAVLVVRHQERYYHVQDSGGTEFVLQRINLEPFLEYQPPEGGPWLPEDHPRVQAYLEATIARRERDQGGHASAFINNLDETVTESYRSQLRRRVPPDLLAAREKFLAEQATPRSRTFYEDLKRDYGAGVKRRS